MRFRLTIAVMLFMIFSSLLYAQDDEDWWSDDSWEDEIGFDIDLFEFEMGPFIELNYGSSKALHNLISNDVFGNLGFAELKLGYSGYEELPESYLVEFEDEYFYVSNFSRGINYENKSYFTEPEMWRFGFAERDGYGYKTDAVSFFPYHQASFGWSRLKLTLPDLRTFAPISIGALERFNEEFRFGTANEAGLNIRFGDGFFGLNAGYETAVIFPRYLIWKHLGSYIIESAAQKAIDSFVDEVLVHSPAAAPIVSFFLKNGLSYAFYSLKKENMNWPFNTEAPLTFETFKLGVTFNF